MNLELLRLSSLLLGIFQPQDWEKTIVFGMGKGTVYRYQLYLYKEKNTALTMTKFTSFDLSFSCSLDLSVYSVYQFELTTKVKLQIVGQHTACNIPKLHSHNRNTSSCSFHLDLTLSLYMYGPCMKKGPTFKVNLS